LRLLIFDQHGHRLGDANELLGGSETLRASGADAFADLRTMKNSSRLLAEIDRNLSRSSRGFFGLADSSSTRRLKFSHDSSRLMKRSGLEARSNTAGRAADSGDRTGSSSCRTVPDSRAMAVAWPRSAMTDPCSSSAIVATLCNNPMNSSPDKAVRTLLRQAGLPGKVNEIEAPGRAKR